MSYFEKVVKVAVIHTTNFAQIYVQKLIVFPQGGRDSGICKSVRSGEKSYKMARSLYFLILSPLCFLPLFTHPKDPPAFF